MRHSKDPGTNFQESELAWSSMPSQGHGRVPNPLTTDTVLAKWKSQRWPSTQIPSLPLPCFLRLAFLLILPGTHAFIKSATNCAMQDLRLGKENKAPPPHVHNNR